MGEIVRSNEQVIGNSGIADVSPGELDKITRVNKYIDSEILRRGGGNGFGVRQLLEEIKALNELTATLRNDKTLPGINPPQPESAIERAFYKFMDSQMGAAVGNKLGAYIPELAKNPRVEALTDQYLKSKDPNYIPPPLDINHALIQHYDQGLPAPTQGNANDGFFNGNQANQGMNPAIDPGTGLPIGGNTLPFGGAGQQTEEEWIMSLNPDNQIDIQRFIEAYVKMTGQPVNDPVKVKKYLYETQEQIRKKMKGEPVVNVPETGKMTDRQLMEKMSGMLETEIKQREEQAARLKEIENHLGITLLTEEQKLQLSSETKVEEQILANQEPLNALTENDSLANNYELLDSATPQLPQTEVPHPPPGKKKFIISKKEDNGI